VTSEPDSKPVLVRYYKFGIFQTEVRAGDSRGDPQLSGKDGLNGGWKALSTGKTRATHKQRRETCPQKSADCQGHSRDERQTAETLKAQEADEREHNKQALAQFASVGDAMRAELDSMTPAERNMPAIIDSTGGGRLNATTQAMADRDSPTMWQVLTPNYDFWRARKSPVEVHSIVVYIGGGAGIKVEDQEMIHNALLQTFKKLDWAALNKLLDVPR
jgi:hypothetical protein